MFKHFDANKTGRDWIVGDVHGHFTRLQAALDARGFDPQMDRLFSVGDLVDRGPESDLALEWLAKPWFHAVRGNHEEMAIEFADGQQCAALYRANGGAWNIANPIGLQMEIRQEFLALPLAIELQTAQGLVVIVHADCPRETWEEFKHAMEAEGDRERQHLATMAIWNRQRIDFGDCSGVPDVRAMVCGHTPVQTAPHVLGNVYFIDSGGWLGRDFCILDAQTLQPVPVNPRG